MQKLAAEKNASLMASAKHGEARYSEDNLGYRVKVEGYEGLGTIAFAGLSHVDKQPVCGVELDSPLGEHDGIFDVGTRGLSRCV